MMKNFMFLVVQLIAVSSAFSEPSKEIPLDQVPQEVLEQLHEMNTPMGCAKTDGVINPNGVCVIKPSEETCRKQGGTISKDGFGCSIKITKENCAKDGGRWDVGKMVPAGRVCQRENAKRLVANLMVTDDVSPR